MSDADWSPDASRLAAFDEAEWARVEAAYAGRLLSYAARRIADVEAREDVVQETFLGAVRGIEGFNPVYTFEQFLFGICRNRTIDQLRRQVQRRAHTGRRDRHRVRQRAAAAGEIQSHLSRGEANI